jgi:hypothetical protein
MITGTILQEGTMKRRAHVGILSADSMYNTSQEIICSNILVGYGGASSLVLAQIREGGGHLIELDLSTTMIQLTVRIIGTNIVHLDDIPALYAALDRFTARDGHPVDRMSVSARASDIAL